MLDILFDENWTPEMPLQIGKITEFSEGKENFVNYVERLEQYFEANEIPNEKRVAVFLSAVGANAYGILRNLVQPGLPKDKTYDELVKTLTDHYMPKPLIISERFKFHKRNQKEGESIADYVVQLKKLTTYCEFKAFLNEALRNRLVCGLKSETIQKKLLSEADLDFDKAVKISTAMETAEKDTQTFTGSDSTINFTKARASGMSHFKGKPSNHSKGFQAPSGKGSHSSYSANCYRCGEAHAPDKCKFKTTKCFKCGKVGHLARAYRSSAVKSANKKVKSTKFVEQDSEVDSDDDVTIFTINTTDSGKSDKTYTVKLSLGQANVDFQLDTGSACTIVNEHVFKNKLSQFKLQKSQLKLKSYTGDAIELAGQCVVPVQYEGGPVKKLTTYVVKGDRPCLLGRDWLGKINLNWKNVLAVVQDNVETLKSEYSCLFESDNDKPIKGYKAQIRVKSNAQPIFCKARPVPYALKESVEQHLRKLQQDGIIYPVKNSRWAAPIVVVPKHDQSLRICGDYKVTINKEISEEQYPLPNTDDMFASLSGGQKFTKLDLKQAYSQLELESASEEYLTINTHLGLFRYKRLAYGVSSAPAIFQSVMDQILSGLPGVLCRIDDILITAPDDTTHLKTLREVFRRLKEHNIKLRGDKCTFMQKEVVYLGHRVDAEGIHPTSEKVEAIRDAPPPTCVKELKAYLGLLNYYGSFLPNLSTLLHPLHNLLKKGEEWKWTKECNEVFEKSKLLVMESNLLVHYDMKKPIRLACDSSSYGVGAVISHIMPNGQEQPIAFASRTLNESERNYPQVEKEALSLIFGVKKFHKYLYGRKFVLVTDHKPLTTIFGPKKGIPTLAAARLQRWALILSGYQYDIEYRCSEDHANCDSLSRLPLKTTTSEENDENDVSVDWINEMPISSRDIARATSKDKILSKVYDFVMYGWPNHTNDEDIKPYFNRRNELSAEQGVILWGRRVVIPAQLRLRLAEELHEEHIGMCRMKALARSYMWWPKIDHDVEEIVKSCSVCQQLRNSPSVAPLHPWRWATRPMQRIHIDFAELKGKSFLIVNDSYSKWLEVIHMKSTTSAVTIDKLRSLFASTGIPEEIVSDNGPQFTSSEFKTFMTNNGIKHTLVPAYHPASNGFAEKGVQIIKKALKAQVLNEQNTTEPRTIQHRLANFLLKYRSTPHTTTGETPAALFLKRELRTKLTLIKPDREKFVREKQETMKKHHDKTHSKVRSFNEGDKVLVKTTLLGGKKWKWMPGIIVRVKGPLTYLVKVGLKTRYCHVDHLIDTLADIPTEQEQFDTDIRVPQPTPPVVTPADPLPSEQEKDLSPDKTIDSKKPNENVVPNTPAETPKTPERRYPQRIRCPPKKYEIEK